jgi:hypothetical protein
VKGTDFVYSRFAGQISGNLKINDMKCEVKIRRGMQE